MSKREDLISKISPILNDRKNLERFIIANSNLPGPRANLELAFAMVEVYKNLEVILEWLKIQIN